MSRWKRVLISFGIVVVACVTYLWPFGTQTFFVLEAHSAARKLPFVRLTPVELTDLSVSQEPGIKLSYFGYEFEVPWTDIDQEKSKIIGGNKAIIAFRSGNGLMVWSGPPHEFMNGFFEPNSGIFTVRGKEFKGFQYGRPQNPPKHLNVELFPEGGHLDLFFDQKWNGPTVISQADINRVLRTIHKVPAEVVVRHEDVNN